MAFNNIKKWWRMLRGKSILHVNQGAGEFYFKNEIKGYYNDLRDKVNFMPNDVLVPKMEVNGKKDLELAVSIFQFGLGAYDLYLQTNDEIYKQKVLACADWAVEKTQENGAIDAIGALGFKNPYSAMSQGQAISLLTRAYKLDNQQKYIDTIIRVKEFLLMPLSEGGVCEHTEQDLYLYEYVDKPLVLNGWIFALWGLLDYAIFFNDQSVLELYNKSLNSLVNTLFKFDKKYWSGYDAGKIMASKFYHQLHIAQLKVLYDFSNEEKIKEYIDKWEKQLNSGICRFRAFIKKAFQKIFER